MALLDTINQKLQYTNDAIDDIGAAAIEKGADISLESDGLATWGDKIREIPSPFYPSITANDAGAIDSMSVQGEYTLPISAETGAPSTTLSFANNEAMSVVLCKARKLIIPSYYITANAFNARNISGYGFPVKEIDYLGSGTFYAERFPNNMDTLETIRIPNGTFSIYPYATGNPHRSGRLSVYSTNFTGGENCNPEHTDIHWTQDESITKTGSLGRFASDFQWFFDHSKTISLSTTYGSLSGNVFMPEVETLSVAQGGYGNVGSALWIGPNLTSGTFSSAYGSTVPLHIPQGDSTTKMTLDALGLTYTQDYII